MVRSFNMCLFLTSNTATMVPLPQTRRDNPTNYHPVSLLSVFSELIEKNMYKCLYSFLDSCSILHPYSLAFTKNIPPFMH